MMKPKVQIGAGPLALGAVRIDGGTQMRVALDEAVVAEYAQTIVAGTDLPPIVVFFDGSTCWLGDGFHRFHAYRKAGALEIPADVRGGTKRDAILHAVGANASHGLRRSNADKRKAVETLLKDEEWVGWSDREIGRQCAVDHKTVGRLREEHLGNSPDRRTVERSGTTYQQATANIGRRVATAEPAESAPPAEARPAPSPPSREDADRGDDMAERRARQARNDREREAVRAALPEAVRAQMVARETATAARRPGASEADVSEADGLTDAQRLEEAKEAIRVLEAENTQLRADVALFEPMRVQWEQGGFEKVLAGKNEEIAVLKIQVENESREKVINLRASDRWRKRALEKGWTADVVIGEASHA